MADGIRVMIEQGKRKAVAAAFDWPGWDRAGASEGEALRVLASYRERYAPVAALAGLSSVDVCTGRHIRPADRAWPDLAAMQPRTCDP